MSFWTKRTKIKVLSITVYYGVNLIMQKIGDKNVVPEDSCDLRLWHSLKMFFICFFRRKMHVFWAGSTKHPLFAHVISTFFTQTGLDYVLTINSETFLCGVHLVLSLNPDCYEPMKSKKISNDQELIQSDSTSCPQNQKGNNLIHKLIAVYERHSR